MDWHCQYSKYDEDNVVKSSNTQEGDSYYIKTEKEYAYQREGNYLPVKSKVTTKQSKESDPANIVVTEYEYNRDQLVTKETRDDEVIAVTAYNDYGIPLEQFQKQNDNTWIGTVNTANMTKITSSKAAKKTSSEQEQAQTFEESTYEYNDSGDMTQSVEAGVTTNYSYSYTNYRASGTALLADSLTKTTTVKEVGNTTNTDGTGSSTQDITVTEQYDWLGRLSQTMDAKGGVTEYGYDLAGRLTQTTYPDDTIVSNDYNDTTNEIVSTAEDGSMQKLTYDSAGRNETGYLYDSAAEVWRMLYRNFYDSDGNLSEKRVYNDNGSEKSKVVYTYYNDGQLKSEIAYEGEAVLSRRELGYEPFQSVGRSNTYAKVYTTSSGYLTANQTVDQYGRRVSDTIQADNGSYVQSYTTDTIGNILTIKDFKANAEGADSPTVTYTYDHANRQVQTATAAGQTEVVYDELGRVEYEQDANGNQVHYYYNGGGNIIRIRQKVDDDTLGETKRYYDVNGNLSREEMAQIGRAHV